MERQEKDEPLEAGMGFTIRTALISKLETFPKLGISDRLMTLCIPPANNAHLTIISAYAPMMMYANDEKEALYQLLINPIHATLKNEKLLLLSDFIAHVRSNSTAWPSVL